MLEAIRNNRRIVQIVLAIIILPFALFGVLGDKTGSVSGSDTLGKIGGEKITVDEFTNRVRELAAMNADPAAADTPAFRDRVLEDMLNERAVTRTAANVGIVVPESLIRDAYTRRPEFQENGKFSPERAKAMLMQSGRSSTFYDKILRDELTQYLLLEPIFRGAPFSRVALARYATRVEEQRAFSEVKIDAISKLPSIKIDAAAVSAYYESNKTSFETPERAKVEYVLLNAEAMAAKETVPEADLRKWYDEHKKNYEGSEERRASHILVDVPEGAKADVKAAARKRAEELLAKVKANPASFAKLAKESSDDKANSEQGGDLGFFARDWMDPAFEKAAFALKPREISDIVESKFGFHIIQLTDVRGGKTRSFESVRDEIKTELQKQAAGKRYMEANVQFGDLVYNEPDSFKSVTDKFGLSAVRSDWVEKGQVGSDPVISDAKVQAVIYSEKSIKERHNSDVIDLGKAGFVSVRLLDYQPRQVRPLETVRAQIESQLKLQEAQKLAKAEGEALLAKLKAGEAVKVTWAATRTLKFLESPSQEFRQALFSPVEESKLPLFAGVTTPEGYSLLRIEKKISIAVTKDDPRVVSGGQFAQAYATADIRSMQLGLRNKLGTVINRDKLPKQASSE
ncbi:peptidyl-prolyl cis-trans isomerase [Viridibacterium curvum]|uniref:Periplasmic chaperone PpiD n=1 Tax=Viridibacterium curvum TaxID=1101404 RepID=A0ABP9QA85_9RHOO